MTSIRSRDESQKQVDVMNSERTILITGFGPFKSHEVNASWEAVKELYELRYHLHELYNVNLVIDHVPVIYDHVLERVPQLWKEHDPMIVLHVGVSHKAKCLTIEHRAHGIEYTRPDISGKCPLEKSVKSSSNVLETCINIEELCRIINDNSTDDSCKACISQDAGRYLCEYIYYQSLSHNPERTLFIHVPDFDVCSSKVVAKGLYEIIELLINSFSNS